MDESLFNASYVWGLLSLFLQGSVDAEFKVMKKFVYLKQLIVHQVSVKAAVPTRADGAARITSGWGFNLNVYIGFVNSPDKLKRPHKCSKRKWIIGVLKMITHHKENIKLLLLLIAVELIKPSWINIIVQNNKTGSSATTLSVWLA